MANTVPATVPTPDPGDLLSGSGLDSAPIAPLFRASNWAMARIGTGTPRISQIFPRRGPSSASDGVFVKDTADSSLSCRWLVPRTRGVTSLRCYVYGSSVGGGGQVEFRSDAGGGVTGYAALPATPGLVDVGALTIDTAGGYDEVQLWVDGSGGACTVDAVDVRMVPLSSPLASGPDADECVAFDASEFATPQALPSWAGKQLRANALALRQCPHVYAQWSGIAGISPSSAKYMRAVPHPIPVIVWADSQRYEWDVTVAVRAKNGTGGDLVARVSAASALTGAPLRVCSITVPSGGEDWYLGSVTLPRSAFLSLPGGWLSALLYVWPRPDSGFRALEAHEGGAQMLSTAQIEAVSAWGV